MFDLVLSETGQKRKLSNFRKLPVTRKAPALHAVAGHLRRVKKASFEAVERARQYGIQMPDSYTFVRPFRKGKKEW